MAQFIQGTINVVADLLVGELPVRINPESDGRALYQWNAEQDMVVVAVLTMLLLVVREVTSDYILRPFAKSFGVFKHMKLVKFAEAGWFFVFYVPMCLWGFQLSFTHQLSFPLHRMYEEYPQDTCGFDMKLYMLLSEAWYFHALVVVAVIQDRRKDFWESCVHHVATILLIFIGRGMAFLHISVTNLILHCPSDILLYLAKLFNYIEYERMCNFVFTMFALSFFVTRILWFPFVIWSWYSYALEANPDLAPYAYHGGTAFMIVLQCLHAMWFRTVVYMVIEALGKGTVEKDARSDDD